MHKELFIIFIIFFVC